VIVIVIMVAMVNPHARLVLIEAPAVIDGQIQEGVDIMVIKTPHLKRTTLRHHLMYQRGGGVKDHAIIITEIS